MSSKETGAGGSPRGFGDVVGIVLITAALLLFASQLSFDRADVSVNRAGPTLPMHNWIGGFGAYLANGFFLLFGVAGFVLPFLLALFGLAYLLQLLTYLRHRWWAGLLLFIATLGILD